MFVIRVLPKIFQSARNDILIWVAAFLLCPLIFYFVPVDWITEADRSRLTLDALTVSGIIAAILFAPLFENLLLVFAMDKLRRFRFEMPAASVIVGIANGLLHIHRGASGVLFSGIFFFLMARIYERAAQAGEIRSEVFCAETDLHKKRRSAERSAGILLIFLMHAANNAAALATIWIFNPNS